MEPIYYLERKAKLSLVGNREVYQNCCHARWSLLKQMNAVGILWDLRQTVVNCCY
ncbi:hypothetical protein MUCCIDRAFT_154840 [Mucor lusitanicus CBS 277.49]|uniref:Uncharacterized protein n=1 Tax=Mucor lusitanicus CBS 277.49 TaxID=747725 RepID=A0A168PRW8_MUCCL|nr:hypothetical protein MUCCIDRAFT_154840 [Mucor lusitanicus CBS 277.49]